MPIAIAGTGGLRSASNPRVRFGLGTDTTLEGILVIWPDATNEVWRSIVANTFNTLQQGSGVIWTGEP